jgi:hypothetical protein
MMSLESQGLLLTFCDRHANGEPLLARGLALAETIGARRFQSIVLGGLAACALAAGRWHDARERIERALGLARETGMGFCGPLAGSGPPARRRGERAVPDEAELLAQAAIRPSPRRGGCARTPRTGDWSMRCVDPREPSLPYAEFWSLARVSSGSVPGGSGATGRTARLRAVPSAPVADHWPAWWSSGR